MYKVFNALKPKVYSFYLLKFRMLVLSCKRGSAVAFVGQSTFSFVAQVCSLVSGNKAVDLSLSSSDFSSAEPVVKAEVDSTWSDFFMDTKFDDGSDNAGSLAVVVSSLDEDDWVWEFSGSDMLIWDSN